MYARLGGIHLFDDDKEGNVVLIVRLKFLHKIPEIIELLKKFVVFQMFAADAVAAKRNNGTGWALMIDCSGAGLANADLEMASFLNNTLKSYFPSGQRYVLVHNLPWLLNFLKNVVSLITLQSKFPYL